MHKSALATICVFACACGTGDPPSEPSREDPLPPPPPSEGVQFAMDARAEPGEEIWKCKISRLETEGVLPVHAVRSVQTPGVHHMDLMVLLESGVGDEPGTYDCAPLYEQHPKLMEETILFAAQQPDMTVTLPEGVAAMVPAGLTLMYELHYVNASTEPVDVFSRVNAYSMPAEEVTGTLWGGPVRDKHLVIPPNGTAVEWTRCVMNADIDLLFVATHTHELGVRTEVKLFDGENAGETIYQNTDWQSPPLASFTDAPIHVKKGQGFEFACHYQNPRSEPVGWGFAAKDEMCNLAIAFTPGEFETVCEVVESSDGVLGDEEG